MKILLSLYSLEKLPKAIIKYGVQIFFLLLTLGTLLMLFNHTIIEYNSYYEFIAQGIIKNSFVLLAETIIGALAFDFVFQKKK